MEKKTKSSRRKRSLTHKDILKIFSKSTDRKLQANSKNLKEDEELQQKLKKMEKAQRTSVRFMDMEVVRLQQKLRRTTLSKSLQSVSESDSTRSPNLKHSRKISISNPGILHHSGYKQNSSLTWSSENIHSSDNDILSHSFPRLPKLDTISPPRLRKKAVAEMKRSSLEETKPDQPKLVKLPSIFDDDEDDDSLRVNKHFRFTQSSSQKTRPQSAMSILQQTIIARGMFLKLLGGKSKESHNDEGMFVTARRRSLSDL